MQTFVAITAVTIIIRALTLTTIVHIIPIIIHPTITHTIPTIINPTIIVLIIIPPVTTVPTFIALIDIGDGGKSSPLRSLDLREGR